MGATAFEQSLGLPIAEKLNLDDRGPIVEEIEGLIKVYKNGYVERPMVVPCVSPSLDKDLHVVAGDVFIDRLTNLWARVYVPKGEGDCKLPLLVYFHGGGFCVGSAAWKCYHEFSGNLSSTARCIIVSINYRLAPENPLPSAYEDGVKALKWVKQQANCQSRKWWTRHCDFSSMFLAGDSAGANLAYHVALKLSDTQITPLSTLRGVILIQPFISGEERTNSEKTMVVSRRSPLSLSTSDAYWRLVLPRGANRDHPWCNPIGEGTRKLMNLRVLVCVAERDILRDRNLEMCSVLAKVGNKVEHLMSVGVGHAFQVLDKSELSQTRRAEMICHIVGFISQIGTHKSRAKN